MFKDVTFKSVTSKNGLSQETQSVYLQSESSGLNLIRRTMYRIYNSYTFLRFNSFIIKENK
jgi:hypothetical protein